LYKTQDGMESEITSLRRMCRNQADTISNLEVDIKTLNKRLESAVQQTQPDQLGILETRIDRVQVGIVQLERITNNSTDAVCALDDRIYNVEKRVSEIDGIVVNHDIDDEEDEDLVSSSSYCLSPTMVLSAPFPKPNLDVIPNPVFNSPPPKPALASINPSILSTKPSLQTAGELFNYICHCLNEMKMDSSMWRKQLDEQKLTIIKKIWGQHLSKHWSSCGSNIRDHRRYGGEHNALNFKKFIKNFDSKHPNWDAKNMPPYPAAPMNVKKKKKKRSLSLKE